MMMRSVLSLLLLLLITTTATAQSRHDVTGTVTDSLDAGLEGATVVMLEASDSTLVSYGITRSDGFFQLRRVPQGSYILQVSFVGFEAFSQPIAVEEGDVDAGRIALATATAELDDLVITAERIPMLVKKDTLEYNVDAFNVRPNANVEELLRRLPGVEVERDGSIKAQGEDVEQVLVDGKEFFGDDPRIATQNLPADAVDKVQVYDKQSDMAEFSGVDDGEESKTINLALKEDAKNGSFGNTSGGYGNDEFKSRYIGKTSINRFSPNTQFSVIGNLNNVNQQGFSINDYISFMGGMSAMMGGGGRFQIAGMPGMNVEDGFSVTTAGGINLNHEFSAKTSIQSSYFYNRIDNEQDRAINEQQLIGAQLSSNAIQRAFQNSLNQSHRLNLTFEHTINEGQDLRLRANLQSSKSDLSNFSNRDVSDGSNSLINQNETLYGSNADNRSGNASLTYRKKLSDNGRTLVAEASGRLDDGGIDGDLEALNTFFDNAGNVMSADELHQLQTQLNETNNSELELSWTEPLGGRKYIEVHGSRRQTEEDQNKRIFDRIGDQTVINQNLSDALGQTYTYWNAGASLRFVNDKGSLTLGGDFKESQLTGALPDRAISLNQTYRRFLPMASFQHEFSGGKNLDLRYRAATREPAMQELQPFADNSDPLNIYIGNPDLRPEYHHTGTVHFMMFDQFSFTNLFGYFQARYATDKISTRRTIDDQFVQTFSPINIDKDWLLTGSLNFGTPIRALGIKVNLSTRTMHNKGTEFINSVENESNILRQTVDLRLENREKDVVDTYIGARYTFNDVAYSLNPELNQNYINRTFYGEFTYNIQNKWRFTAGLDYRLFADEVFGSGRKIPLLRAEVSRTLMREKAEIQLVGLDLLNENVGVNYTNTANLIREEQVNSLGRYVMLKFVYNLSGIGGSGGIHFVADGD